MKLMTEKVKPRKPGKSISFVPVACQFADKMPMSRGPEYVAPRCRCDFAWECRKKKLDISERCFFSFFFFLLRRRKLVYLHLVPWLPVWESFQEQKKRLVLLKRSEVE